MCRKQPSEEVRLKSNFFFSFSLQEMMTFLSSTFYFVPLAILFIFIDCLLCLYLPDVQVPFVPDLRPEEADAAVRDERHVVHREDVGVAPADPRDLECDNRAC